MKRVITAVLGGMIALGAWSSVANGLLGVQQSIEMKRLADDREIYNLLVRRVAEPGRYVLNPTVQPGRPFPGEEPVFSVQYSGIGHADAWMEVVAALAAYLLVMLLGALLLSNASVRVRSRFSRRLLFFSGIGAVCAVFRCLAEFGIGSYRLADAGILALNDFAGWMVAGLVVAGILRAEGNTDRA